MPEYLSPGVYMEEFEIGAKPIEGVSTSTAGFVGVAERGPLNKPTLVTSFGDYTQIFGGYLDQQTYNKTYYLPYAVENFFSNGGKRVYIVRVAKSDAAAAAGFVPDVSGGTTTLKDAANAKSITIKLSDVTKVKPNDILLIKDKDQSEYIKYISKAKNVILDSGLQNTYSTDANVDKMKLGTTLTCKISSTGGAKKGDKKITLDNTTGLNIDQAVYIADITNPEICYIDTIDSINKSINLKTALVNDHAKDTALNDMILDKSISKPLLAAAKTGSNTLSISASSSDFTKGDIVKLSTKEYFIIKDIDADPNIILLDQELQYKHESNTEIVQLIPAIEITALNEGSWGNNLKIITKASSISDKIKVLEDVTNSNTIKVSTIAGVEKGTLLKISDTQYITVDQVIKTDTENKIVATTTIISILKDTIIATAEFDLIIQLDNTPVEIFKNLSLDTNHSRFIEIIITNKTSHFIVAKKKNSLSALPMPTQDKAPGWMLSGGKDGIPANDGDINTVYEGGDDAEPANRTGLYALKNIDGISIVAMPGITTQHMQGKLINHCELMKNRFAVLDSIAQADLDQIQEQRNYYDSDYAALYYPWISLFDPISKDNINVPPSGSVCGIYARSDTERGVHKAPANEVVSNAVELENIGNSYRIITTGQQDILNPKGVNCIRVFPGRGIRVWGARTLSSDQLWKYVNVRRLFIYIEESIEQGTQWVVFEPNDIPLWARVRQTITQFLTDVWRSGALAGATPEEAFFVKCDRTTMSQGDIDNGRLICIIGVAPVKPAEFVIFRIAQWTGGAKS